MFISVSVCLFACVHNNCEKTRHSMDLNMQVVQDLC